MKNLLTLYVLAIILLLNAAAHAMDQHPSKLSVGIINNSTQSLLIDSKNESGLRIEPNWSAAIYISLDESDNQILISSANGVNLFEFFSKRKGMVAFLAYAKTGTFIPTEKTTSTIPLGLMPIQVDATGLATFQNRSGVEESIAKPYLLLGQTDQTLQLSVIRRLIKDNHNLLATIKKAKNS